MRQILIAAYHPLILKGIKQAVVENEPGSKVVATATNIHDFLYLIGKLKPDTAIVDVSVTWKCKLDMLKEIHQLHPEIELHFINVHPLDNHVNDYLVKQAKAGFFRCTEMNQLAFI